MKDMAADAEDDRLAAKEGGEGRRSEKRRRGVRAGHLPLSIRKTATCPRQTRCRLNSDCG
jgi:hypothetical protein